MSLVRQIRYTTPISKSTSTKSAASLSYQDFGPNTVHRSSPPDRDIADLVRYQKARKSLAYGAEPPGLLRRANRGPHLTGYNIPLVDSMST